MYIAFVTHVVGVRSPHFISMFYTQSAVRVLHRPISQPVNRLLAIFVTQGTNLQGKDKLPFGNSIYWQIMCSDLSWEVV